MLTTHLCIPNDGDANSDRYTPSGYVYGLVAFGSRKGSPISRPLAIAQAYPRPPLARQGDRAAQDVRSGPGIGPQAGAALAKSDRAFRYPAHPLASYLPTRAESTSARPGSRCALSGGQVLLFALSHRKGTDLFLSEFGTDHPVRARQYSSTCARHVLAVSSSSRR